MQSQKYKIEIVVTDIPKQVQTGQPARWEGTGGSVRVALARAAEKLAPSLRTLKGPLIVEIKRVY